MSRDAERIFRKSMALSALGLGLLGAFGCGQQGGETKRGVPGSEALLKDDQLLKPASTAKGKVQMSVDMKERRRLLREAEKKIETH